MKQETKVNILIVDDKPESLLSLEALLETPGYNIVKANSGLEALKCLLNDDFAVILLDVQMPDMDGFETATLIRKRERSQLTPIIFITGVGTDEIYMSKGYSIGAVDYMLKPVIPEILKAKVAFFAEAFKNKEKLRYQAEELARSNAELQEFAYIASHDLQEPLRKIQAFGERLNTKASELLDKQCKDYLDRMMNASERMQHLISDLLKYSRVTTQARTFIPIALSEVVREVLSDLETRIEQENGCVDVGNLPTIEIDPLQIRQLFQNLISNSLKFHKDGIAPKIIIRSEFIGKVGNDSLPTSSEQLCRITVQDNGIGFDEKYLDRIFKIFQRLHGREKYKGTGIGLALCHKIIKRHGGHITAKSKPGKGATFIITLPATQTKKGEVS